ncbi:uncharacterized protein EKO05_0007392 [Ascochyta rabiei]|uniref:uncharacterized protein n=1 Tax=Didymella rabiei TaxID=5454 RepID=UPI0022065CFC|nr:uncharacterized protein EKO05_0007392 [Ascochyta rabiei]UPX17015.1 hypothetical protein EKO05_0007392 [Ascochyta rabiei]
MAIFKLLISSAKPRDFERRTALSEQDPRNPSHYKVRAGHPRPTEEWFYHGFELAEGEDDARMPTRTTYTKTSFVRSLTGNLSLSARLRPSQTCFSDSTPSLLSRCQTTTSPSPSPRSQRRTFHKARSHALHVTERASLHQRRRDAARTRKQQHRTCACHSSPTVPQQQKGVQPPQPQHGQHPLARNQDHSFRHPCRMHNTPHSPHELIPRALATYLPSRAPTRPCAPLHQPRHQNTRVIVVVVVVMPFRRAIAPCTDDAASRLVR